MTPHTHDHLAVLAHQREALGDVRKRAEQAHCLAILVHITAQIRAACPKAVYVAFTYDSKRRELYLHGILGAQSSPLGTCPWLWDGSDEDDPLTELENTIVTDVQSALMPYDSLAWAAVRHDSASDGNRLLLELPPPDRAERIAQLVRAYHPHATGLAVDGRSRGGRVIEIIENDGKGGSRWTRQQWTAEVDDALTRLIQQIFALPALAERHLQPTRILYIPPSGHAASDLIRLMPLPPTF